MSKNLVTVSQFEQKVNGMEDLKVVIRAGKNTLVPDYPFERKASGNCNITNFINQRIRPLVGDLEVEILDGNAIQPHGRTLLSTCRDTFEK